MVSYPELCVRRSINIWESEEDRRLHSYAHHRRDTSISIVHIHCLSSTDRNNHSVVDRLGNRYCSSHYVGLWTTRERHHAAKTTWSISWETCHWKVSTATVILSTSCVYSHGFVILSADFFPVGAPQATRLCENNSGEISTDRLYYICICWYFWLSQIA